MMSLLCVVATTYAQDDKDSDFQNPIRKGRFIGELDLGFDSGDFSQTHGIYVSDVESKNRISRLDARIGYTFIDNLVVGLAFGNDHQKQEVTTPDLIGFAGTGSTSLTRTTGGFIGLGATYFFGKKKFRPFAGFSLGRSHVKAEIEDQNSVTELSGNGFGYTLDLGLAYFINDHIGFEVRYVHYSNSSDVSGSGTASGFAFDLSYEEKQKINIFEFGIIVAF